MLPINAPLRPKNSTGPLKVLVVGRTSTDYQNLESIDASYRFVEMHLARLYDGPVHFKQLGERASGMLAGRATIREAEELIFGIRFAAVMKNFVALFPAALGRVVRRLFTLGSMRKCGAVKCHICGLSRTMNQLQNL